MRKAFVKHLHQEGGQGKIFAIFAVVLILFGAWFLFAKGGVQKRSAQTFVVPETDNVVLIVIDTLRADHLPFYGYSKNTAPFLNELAGESIVFEEAFSTCSSTAPSMASIFTSLHPSEHGVITGHLATEKLMKQSEQMELNRIPEALTTLGEEFKNAGFRTVGVADNLNISDEMGFTQGFEQFDTFRYKGAPNTTAIAKGWKTKFPGREERTFYYVHFMDPHAPYNERQPWFEPSEDALQRKKNAYDSEIRFTDEHIKELFELYKWKENSLIVVIADHGEEFNDHGGFGHGKNLYTEVIRVPFFIYHRNFGGQRISERVHHTDVLPTLVALINQPPSSSWEGRNLIPLFYGESLGKRPLFSELLRRPEHSRSEMRSVVAEDHHLILETTKKGKKKRQMYHLPSDFREQKNIVKEKTELASTLEKGIESFASLGQRHSEGVSIPVDKEAMEHLKTLGYVE